jgi:hypothetical protein
MINILYDDSILSINRPITGGVCTYHLMRSGMDQQEICLTFVFAAKFDECFCFYAVFPLVLRRMPVPYPAIDWTTSTSHYIHRRYPIIPCLIRLITIYAA